MKTPRVTDFDPDAKVPSLKSPMEGMPVIGKPPQQQSRPTPTPPQEQQPSPPAESHPSPQQTSVTTTSKRAYVRRTFDFYEEQIAFLTREALQDRLAGNETSMNAMVREAIDDWIKKRTSAKERL